MCHIRSSRQECWCRFLSWLPCVFGSSCHGRKCLGFCSTHRSRSVVCVEETERKSSVALLHHHHNQRRSVQRRLQIDVTINHYGTCSTSDSKRVQFLNQQETSRRYLFLMDTFCCRSTQSTWSLDWTSERIKLLAADYFIGLLLSRPNIWWFFFSIRRGCSIARYAIHLC